MLQSHLFHERIEDAISAVIDRCGGRKAFACELYPDKPPRDAHNLLDACLNPERREKLAPSQLLFVMKRGRSSDCHDLALFLMRESGYSDPLPVDPEDEVAKMQREFIDATRRLTSLAAKIEATQSRVKPRAVA